MPSFIAETTAILERTPGALRALLIGLPEGWTDTPDVTDGWRPRDVVGHLITGEQTDWIKGNVMVGRAPVLHDCMTARTGPDRTHRLHRRPCCGDPTGRHTER